MVRELTKGSGVHPHQHCKDLCGEALDGIRNLIPEDLYRDVHDYIHEHNEWGLGLEILIAQIGEFEIKISPDQFRLFYVAMASMGMENDDHLNYLSDHNVVA